MNVFVLVTVKVDKIPPVTKQFQLKVCINKKKESQGFEETSRTVSCYPLLEHPNPPWRTL